MSTKDEQIMKVGGQVLIREGGKQAIYAVDTTPGEAGRPCTLLIAPEGSTQVPRVWTEQQMRALKDDINKLKKQFVDLVCQGSGDIHVELEAVNDLFSKHGITLAP